MSSQRHGFRTCHITHRDCPRTLALRLVCPWVSDHWYIPLAQLYVENMTWLCTRCQAYWQILTKSQTQNVTFGQWHDRDIYCYPFLSDSFSCVRSTTRRNWNQRFHRQPDLPPDSSTTIFLKAYVKVGYKGKSCRIEHKISFPAGQPSPPASFGFTVYRLISQIPV